MIRFTGVGEEGRTADQPAASKNCSTSHKEVVFTIRIYDGALGTRAKCVYCRKQTPHTRTKRRQRDVLIYRETSRKTINRATKATEY